jgi:hypothetical protein
VRYFWPESKTDRRSDVDGGAEARDLAADREALLRLRNALAEVKFALNYQRLRRKYGFNPNQPRVPAGNPDGGQWTSEGGSTRVRLAVGDKPRLGRASLAILALEAAKRLIEAYRSENFLRDLFGNNDGTVATTTINGTNILGPSSGLATYTDQDDIAAMELRDTLLEKYPDVLTADNIGRRPNDALFHAETTVLLRAARENGGSLAGQTLEVFVDRPMCRSCDLVLPYVGWELGNPTVTFVGPTGLRKTMRNGRWLD